MKDKDSSEYLYDGLGRRIRAIEDDIATDYLYDNLTPIIETKNNKTTTYTRNPNYSGGIGGIISSLKTNEDDEGKEFYYHYDGLGSVTNLSDRKGKTKANYSYDAFGNLINRKGGKSNPYTFSTKEQDKTGLIYFGARYYNPSIGRFITQDPLGTIDGLNLYTYVNNNPVNWIDPWGLEKKKYSESHVSWLKRWAWEPEKSPELYWEWQKTGNQLPPSWVIEQIGYSGPITVQWRNKSYYTQYGKWKWDYYSGHHRFDAKWGNKIENTEGYVYPVGEEHKYLIIIPNPKISPQPDK